MKSDKTCNEGRFLHPSLGGAKMSKCPQCNQKLDRDQYSFEKHESNPGIIC